MIPSVFLALCSLLMPARDSGAAPFDPRLPGWDSLAGFVQLATEEAGGSPVEVGTSLDYDALRPEDALIFVHPLGDLDLPSLSRFLHAGGRVVLLDDFGDGDRLLAHFGMRREPLDEPSQTLAGNLAWPIAKPVGFHPTISGADRVILNHASAIRHPDLSPVLAVELRSGEKRTVAVAGSVGKGRLLAVSDASVFLDSMLRFEGNAAFARGLVRYALEDDSWGNRGGTLHVLTETVTQTGVYGETSPAMALLEELARSLREAWRQQRDAGFSGTLALILAAGAALACVTWVLRSASKLHRPQLPRYLAAVAPVSQAGLEGHVALLTAATTPRTLVLLEWKQAFEERLAALLGVVSLPPQSELLEMLARRGLDARQLAELRQLLFRLSRAETWLLSRGRGPSVSQSEVVRLTARLDGFLAMLTPSSDPPRRSDPPPQA